MRTWYIYSNNQYYGPFLFSELQGMIDQHRILPETLIQNAEDGQWHYANT